MAIFARGNDEKPDWLPQTQDFCRSAGIKIMGWGPNLLTVEAKTHERAQAVASQLGKLGFKVVENKDNTFAGMLDLSKNPGAVQGKIASFSISRRRWDEQIEPILWGICGAGLLFSGLKGGNARNSPWLIVSLGVLSAILFFWRAPVIWGWRLELLPEALRIRQVFRWTSIPWSQIIAVESERGTGRQQEAVFVKLNTHSKESLGTFNVAFARNLRDRLRYELAQRRS